MTKANAMRIKRASQGAQGRSGEKWKKAREARATPAPKRRPAGTEGPPLPATNAGFPRAEREGAPSVCSCPQLAAAPDKAPCVTRGGPIWTPSGHNTCWKVAMPNDLCGKLCLFSTPSFFLFPLLPLPPPPNVNSQCPPL